MVGKRKKRSSFKRFLLTLFCFVLVGAGVFFGVQYVTKTGIFRIPGVVYYDESLSEKEKELLETFFTDEIDLDKDVTISARNELKLPELEEGEFLYSIRVAVTDFYDFNVDNINFESADELLADKSVTVIDLDDLDSKKTLLKINNKYYLDVFDEGAIFRIIKFDSKKYVEEIEPLVSEAMTKKFPSKETVLTFAQTGVTALSRGMNQKLYSVGDATYFAANIKDYLSSFDITHTSNESSFTDYANSRNICSDKRFINTLLAIGLDVVELTGNHNMDCGDQAAIETVETYLNNGIKIVGGGRSAEEAYVPLEINQKRNNIYMMAFNQSTGGATYDSTPGANQYYEEVAKNQIAEAKAAGLFVIVDVQYNECNAYASTYEDTTCDYATSAAGDQVGLFRHLIDLGADIVVGTSAHQPQTFEVYGNGVIYYGLGNLFFDQVWWPGTTRSLVLSHYFYKSKLLQTKIIPTVYGDEMQPRLMDKETATWFLNRLASVHP
ncbi:CapA family protein [Candidatus Saccharibacteria bacterium]|nr:CapA family protein [Candidatus Saccharibacteria bacterium]